MDAKWHHSLFALAALAFSFFLSTEMMQTISLMTCHIMKPEQCVFKTAITLLALTGITDHIFNAWLKTLLVLKSQKDTVVIVNHKPTKENTKEKDEASEEKDTKDEASEEKDTKDEASEEKDTKDEASEEKDTKDEASETSEDIEEIKRKWQDFPIS
jgi:Mg-chelatase subunit ChlI